MVIKDYPELCKQAHIALLRLLKEATSQTKIAARQESKSQPYSGEPSTVSTEPSIPPATWRKT